MLIIGITGGIGSGKSSVSEIFRLCGIPVYIADDESKKLTDSSPVIREKLIELFGNEIYEKNKLNKVLLASHIFTNKEKLEKVNKIIHPEVRKDFERWIKKQNNKHRLIAVETAILFESGFDKFTDKIITIYAPVEIRINRIVKRDNTTREKALDRINSQMSDEDKIKMSDYVITADDKHSLIEQVIILINKLEETNKQENAR